MLLAVFAACTTTPPENSDDNNVENTGDGTNTTDESTAPVEKITLFNAGEQTKYIIVYPDEASDSFSEIVLQMVDEINSNFPDVNVTCQRAFKTWGTDFYNDYEILIGDTGREESNDAATLLKSNNQYVIKLYDSGKLVINAKQEEILCSAILYFLSTHVNGINNSELTLDTTYAVSGEDTAITRLGWELSALPCYWGGVLSEKMYDIGEGIAFTENGGKMNVISQTNVDEFNQYLSDLQSAGFQEVSANIIGNNKYAQYIKDETLVYTYYTDAEKEVRVIHDVVSDPENEFEYSYTAKNGEEPAFYQYALMYDPTGKGGYNPPSKPYENCGLTDIIKLSDNSVVLLDGGWTPQATDDALDALIDFLREITNTPENEKVRIAALYFTHGHNDHVYFAKRLVEERSEHVEIERVMHNFPVNGGGAEYEEMSAALLEKYPNVKFAKIHTGQAIQLADVTFEVFYTHEDMVSPKGDYEIIDFNNTSTVIKMFMNSKTFMLTGDFGGNWTITQSQATIDEYALIERQFLAAFMPEGGENDLKCDVVQISHHAINDWMGNIWAAIDADVAFIPQADVTYDKMAHACFKNVVNQLRETGLTDNDIHFAGRYTYGITVDTNGKITLTSRDIAGADAEYLKLINESGLKPFHQPLHK